ncbi:MAG: aminomethyl-transferring glycine dehydrogenase subunit GcvPA [Prevotella sp.]|uniref:aminomethyl-transferring glycine dehydrogenase subunit GcvPA n=1 Tax=Prevotella sp. TaxID=59823 RepID=UPI0025883E5E|nr:aminomethyl-transferring glycine dehydrogenase subunit GcvPA [Prevotella sp.]MDD6853475.1 aminomethyl-transferring glycine dehydrogenase subunit GcvPA [Prevotella sp.]
MMYKYFPHTPEDIAGMLAKVGAESLEDLYAELPREVLYKGDYDLPSAMSEVEVRRFFDRLGRKNRQLVCFAGAGIYDHYAPSAIPQLIERSEFLTSYTPYQAEISQGTLHYIFEYQSMMAELTGMDISNASMYDGATATAEAMLLAFNNSRKADTVLYSSSLDPKTVDVMRTYAHFHGVRLEEFNSLTTSAEDLKARVDKGDIAGVIVQQPDYYGIIEDFTGYADACHSKKALFVVNSIASDLALLKTPGEWGADLAVGDVQSLGVPMSFGGPTAGYMCSTEKLMRKLPGRIVGKTHDGNGQRVFVLTLQAREQHIRRQKATSNICSNESLMALYVTIYMSLMGKEGLKEAATISYDGAHYLCDKLIATGKARLVYDNPFFNEFLVDIDGRDEFYDRAVEKGFVPGVKVGRSGLLIAVTEQRTKDEADELAALL